MGYPRWALNVLTGEREEGGGWPTGEEKAQAQAQAGVMHSEEEHPRPQAPGKARGFLCGSFRGSRPVPACTSMSAQGH